MRLIHLPGCILEKKYSQGVAFPDRNATALKSVFRYQLYVTNTVRKGRWSGRCTQPIRSTMLTDVPYAIFVCPSSRIWADCLPLEPTLLSPFALSDPCFDVLVPLLILLATSRGEGSEEELNKCGPRLPAKGGIMN
jgi:hypothetical protein